MHLWDLQTGTYPWLTDPEVEELPFASIKNLAADYLLSDYLQDATTVELAGLVHVEAAWNPANPVDESEWLAKALASFGKPYSIVAAGNLLEDAFPDLLAAHRQASDCVVGVRQILNYHIDPTYTFTDNPEIILDKTWRKNFAHLGNKNLSFDLQIFPDQSKVAADLAQEFPQTKMIINHFIMPLKWDRDGVADWKVELAKLAKHKNIAIKLSGLYMYHRDWPRDAMNTLIDTALELFTPERVMWGSNFPVDRQFITLEKLVSNFETSLARHDLAIREAVMWKSANSWYRLGSN
jgi:predicted TIM-barrel fold metal-dependent hydrolase